MPLKILCFDDLKLTRLDTFKKLNDFGITVLNVSDSSEFFAAAENDHFSAIVCAINSESLKEFEYIKMLKKRNEYVEIPLIIISRFADRNCILKAVEIGAQEYIAKPYEEETLVGKILSVLKLKNYEGAEKSIPAEDILTFNFYEMFNKEIKAASRGGYELSLILIAITDRLNLCDNDKELHETAVNLYKVIKTKLRDTDSVFLYGNEKLAVILPFTDKVGSKVVHMKIKHAFDNHAIMKKVGANYSFAACSASYPEDGKIQSKLLEKLEQDLNFRISRYGDMNNGNELLG